MTENVFQNTLFFFVFVFFFTRINIGFPAQAEYSYFSADVRLKIFLCFFLFNYSVVVWLVLLLKKGRIYHDPFCGLVHVFGTVCHTYVLHVPFIELSLASSIWLVQVFVVLFFYGLDKNNCIVFTNFQHKKLYSFQNLILGFILKIS